MISSNGPAAWFLVALLASPGAAPGTASKSPSRDSEKLLLPGLLRGLTAEQASAAELFVTTTRYVGVETEVAVVTRPVVAADGSFAVDVDAAELQGLVRGSCAIWAYVPGRPLAIEWEARAATPLTKLTLVDASGAPVVGARVTPLSVGEDRWSPPRELQERASATTDAGGGAWLPFVDVAALGTVAIALQDGAELRVHWLNGTHSTTFELPPAAPLDLALTADGRMWPSDRPLELQVIHGDSGGSRSTVFERRTVRTDAAGRVHCDRVTTGGCSCARRQTPGSPGNSCVRSNSTAAQPRHKNSLPNGCMRSAQPQARLLMAQALAEVEPEAARAELDAGLTMLGAATAPVQQRAALGLALLPCVEAVAPDRVEECFWRALAWRNPASASEMSVAGALLRGDGLLAFAAARYDPAVARHLLARIAPWLDEALHGDSTDATSALCAWAAIDPNRAQALFERATATPNASLATTERDVRLSKVVGRLLRNGDDRFDQFLAWELNLWIPDTED